ncbi:MAG: HNH endonuclease [Magnetovibrio sp.]|nr:HNH endonuclease [Magnetovibrio sp.]
MASTLYGYKWKKARAKFLKEHPVCEGVCKEDGRVAAASVVDHVIPHRGDLELFWDRSNWQALCKSCHDRHKQRLEKSGTVTGCTESGVPLDPNHHWVKSKRGKGG